jgi:amidophosphoribosyltransferase
VRGTTLLNVVQIVRNLGASAVHIRIGCPPIRYPCKYGINTQTREELIAVRLNPEEICRDVQADSLEFLPLQALRDLSKDSGFCFACMDGDYW